MDGALKPGSILEEVDFSDLNESINNMLESAVAFVTGPGGIFQVSMFSRKWEGCLVIRWLGRSQSHILNPDIEKLYKEKKPIRRDAPTPTLQWEVLDCEMGVGSAPRWLEMVDTGQLFPVSPAGLERVYVADVRDDEATKRSIPLYLRARDSKPVDYRSSVFVPIKVTPRRPSALAGSQLVGILSMDCETEIDVLLAAKETLRYCCTLANALRRTFEALDLAFYDFLLGDEGVVSNAFYYRRIAAIGDPTCLALIYCDLNDFKAVNDDDGHAEGDKVIRNFGRMVMKACLGAPEIFGRFWLCRFGGDEFGVLFEQSDYDDAALRKWVGNTLLRMEVRCSCGKHAVVPAVGIATWQGVLQEPEAVVDGEKTRFDLAEELRQFADDAMYGSKRIWKELPNHTRVAVPYDLVASSVRRIKKKQDLEDLRDQSWTSDADKEKATVRGRPS